MSWSPRRPQLIRVTVIVSTNRLDLCLALYCMIVGLAKSLSEILTRTSCTVSKGIGERISTVYHIIKENRFQEQVIVYYLLQTLHGQEIQTVKTLPIMAECCPPPATCVTVMVPPILVLPKLILFGRGSSLSTPWPRASMSP